MADETKTEPNTPAAPTAGGGARFVNGMRLNARQWLAVAGIVTAILLAVPLLWKKMERFEPGPDYRIPYQLSRDYWLYSRRMEKLGAANVAVVGDSVIWGEYVRPEGTVSHFLNEETGNPGRFVNAGVNGLFPLAFEGLIRDYGASLSHRKVILHCNLLWMSSPKADLHTEKEEQFNHADLVPQFSPRIPCYKADLNKRLASVIERHFTFSQWVNHIQVAYFDQRSFLAWTLDENDSAPPGLPNAFKNPFTQITMKVPDGPPDDPDRGPASPRHRPWSTTGEGSARFEWVEPGESLQWGAFQRLVKLLQSRGNEVIVLIGPFNEHIMSAENRPGFRRLRDAVAGWLGKNEVPHMVPEPLPAALYADASHPLTEGYQLIAKILIGDPVFRKWLEEK